MKYPIEPLAAALHIRLNQTGSHGNHDTPQGDDGLAEHLHITARRLRRIRAQGGWTKPHTADHYAITIGSHPAIIWPGWDRDIPDHLTDANWYTDDPPLDELDDPPADWPPFQPTMVA